MPEWYRPNAGIVVFNSQKKVLLCQRNDLTNAWQFPQGGIEKGETPSAAALRELQEETSIINVQLIKTLTKPARYTFSPEILQKMQAKGFTNSGQDMYWSLCYFYGTDDEINLQTSEPEFKNFRWCNIEEAYETVVAFKKPAYTIMLEEFSPLIANYIV